MDFSFLPQKVQKALSSLNTDKLYEIRLRKGFPVKVIYDKNVYYLTQNGISKFRENTIIAEVIDIEKIIMNVTEDSVYAFNDKIVGGYLTTKNGVRIGVAGKCVTNNGKVVTIKDFSSLNVRIPHKIIGAAKKILRHVICSDSINNTLIISPPFYGKTTILKDLIATINEKFCVPILIVDERGEFEGVEGENIDVISFSDKSYAFNAGIRSMSPSVIVVDELAGKEDWIAVKNAVLSGVYVLASCHGRTIDDIRYKSFFIEGVFKRYVLLKGYGSPGTVDSVYDEEFGKL